MFNIEKSAWCVNSSRLPVCASLWQSARRRLPGIGVRRRARCAGDLRQPALRFAPALVGIESVDGGELGGIRFQVAVSVPFDQLAAGGLDARDYGGHERLGIQVDLPGLSLGCNSLYQVAGLVQPPGPIDALVDEFPVAGDGRR